MIVKKKFNHKNVKQKYKIFKLINLINIEESTDKKNIFKKENLLINLKVFLNYKITEI